MNLFQGIDLADASHSIFYVLMVVGIGLSLVKKLAKLAIFICALWFLVMFIESQGVPIISTIQNLFALVKA